MLPVAENTRAERTEAPGTHGYLRVYDERSGYLLQPMSLHQRSVLLAEPQREDLGSQTTTQTGSSVHYPFSIYI